MTRPSGYAVIIWPLAGNGYIAQVPDLPGCMSDGETPNEAFDNVQDAIACWIEAAQEMGRDVPPPTVPPETGVTPTIMKQAGLPKAF
jgi:antitoxin HicB